MGLGLKPLWAMALEACSRGERIYWEYIRDKTEFWCEPQAHIKCPGDSHQKKGVLYFYFNECMI